MLSLHTSSPACLLNCLEAISFLGRNFSLQRKLGLKFKSLNLIVIQGKELFTLYYLCKYIFYGFFILFPQRCCHERSYKGAELPHIQGVLTFSIPIMVPYTGTSNHSRRGIIRNCRSEGQFVHICTWLDIQKC